MEQDGQTLKEAEINLNVAKQNYEEATKAYNIARSHQTAMLNSLNTAQKLFDKAVSEIKGEAPRDSDWHHDKRKNKV